MMRIKRYWSPKSVFCFTPAMVRAMIAALAIALGGLLWLMQSMLNSLNTYGFVDLSLLICLLFLIGIFCALAALHEKRTRTIEDEMLYRIMKRFFDLRFGNPLGLKEGDLLPTMSIDYTSGKYTLRIFASSVSLEAISGMGEIISGCLTGRLASYAVTAMEEDLAGCYVDFKIEDVLAQANSQRVIRQIDDYIPNRDYHTLTVKDDYVIDYAKVPNGSVIVAGRTRSGKTTGIITVFLLPILALGRDMFNSQSVIIIDPKNAELSTCPHVLSPSLDGDVRHILDAIKDFNETRKKRQEILNTLSRENGHPTHWFEQGMHPCILFIDEFVTLQGLFPRKAPKDDPEYCQEEFKSLIRQLATQGASAGCYLILSTAEASVGTGGLETIVNNACGIRILFRPSKQEAAFLWTPEEIEHMHERSFGPGDAWISVDDGEHRNVQFIRFPLPQIGEYKELTRLLQRFYGD